MQVVPALTHRCSSIYDGSFTDGKSGGNEVIFAVAQARSDTHAGRYLLNSTGGPAGWAPTSNTSAVYRRCMTYSVRPVIDPDVQEDYKSICRNKSYSV